MKNKKPLFDFKFLKILEDEAKLVSSKIQKSVNDEFYKFSNKVKSMVLLSESNSQNSKIPKLKKFDIIEYTILSFSEEMKVAQGIVLGVHEPMFASMSGSMKIMKIRSETVDVFEYSKNVKFFIPNLRTLTFNNQSNNIKVVDNVPIFKNEYGDSILEQFITFVNHPNPDDNEYIAELRYYKDIMNLKFLQNVINSNPLRVPESCREIVLDYIKW